MADAWELKKSLDENGRLHALRQNLEVLPEGTRAYGKLLEQYAPGDASIPERIELARGNVMRTVIDGEMRQHLKDALNQCKIAFERTGKNSKIVGEHWITALDQAIVLCALEAHLTSLSGDPHQSRIKFEELALRLRGSRLLQVRQLATHFSPETRQWIIRLGYSVSKPAAPIEFQLKLSLRSRLITAGSPVEISWKSQNCTKITLDGIAVQPSGNRSFVLQRRREFVLRAVTPEGKVEERRATVDVAAVPKKAASPPLPPPPPLPRLPIIREMSVSPARVRPGETIAVFWSILYATHVLMECEAIGVSKRVSLAESKNGLTLHLPRNIPSGAFFLRLRCGPMQEQREITVVRERRVVPKWLTVLGLCLLLLALWSRFRSPSVRSFRPTPVLNEAFVGRWQGSLAQPFGSRLPLTLTLQVSGTGTAALGVHPCRESLMLAQQTARQATLHRFGSGYRCAVGPFQLQRVLLTRSGNALKIIWIRANGSIFLGTLVRGGLAAKPEAKPNPGTDKASVLER